MIQVLYGNIEPYSCSVELLARQLLYCFLLLGFYSFRVRILAPSLIHWDGLSPQFLLPTFRCDSWPIQVVKHVHAASGK